MSTAKLNAQLSELKPGQEVVVETEAELLNGNIKSLSISLQTLELSNAHDLKRGYRYPAAQILAFETIKTLRIKPVENEATTSTSNTKTTNDSPQLRAGESDKGAPNDVKVEQNTTLLVSINCEQLEEHLGNVIYIIQPDSKYHRALAAIKKQPVVGLLVEHSRYGRHRRTSVIVVATYDSVYIFDIFALGKLFKDLKQMLEAKRPIKALHYGHLFNDHLLHRHQVRLDGIFDTFVAYCFVKRKKRNISLVAAVQNTFDVPAIYFQNDNNGNPELDDYADRPLTTNQIRYLAKKAVFQLKLYDHLLHEQMLANFYQQCKNFSQCYEKLDDAVDVATHMNSNSNFGFEHIHRNGSLNETLSWNPF